MDQPSPTHKARPAPSASDKSLKQKRLSEALRQNLQRRKAVPRSAASTKNHKP